MFPLTSSELDDLQKDDLKSLVKLDDNGFFAGVGESFADFKTRLAAEKKELKKFAEDVKNNKEVKIFDDIKVSQNDLIGKDIMREATKKTRELYDFEIDYLPGFFLNKDIGLLWGGCSIYDEETYQRIFLIRKNFKKQKKWFIYNRQELLAHELCHGARQILNDRKLEEFFAYQTSSSSFRRYIGNCFISEFDAILFVLPPVIMFLAQLVKIYCYENLSILPFWLLTFGVLGFFGVRNHLSRRIFFRAESKLNEFKISKVRQLLFRCTSNEMQEIARLNSRADFLAYLKEKARNDIRFQVIIKKWNLNEQFLLQN